MAKRNSLRKQAQKHDLRNNSFVMLPKAVIESPAFNDLNSAARLLLIAILSRFNGHNNGQISLSHREAAPLIGHTSPKTIVKAFKDLMEHGLIEVTMEGDWAGCRAREYRLTFITTGKVPPYKNATNDYVDWQPPPKKKKSHSIEEAENPYSATAKVAKRSSATSPKEAVISNKPSNSANRFDLQHFPKGSTYMIPSPPELANPKSQSDGGEGLLPKMPILSFPKDQMVLYGLRSRKSDHPKAETEDLIKRTAQILTVAVEDSE